MVARTGVGVAKWERCRNKPAPRVVCAEGSEGVGGTGGPSDGEASNRCRPAAFLLGLASCVVVVEMVLASPGLSSLAKKFGKDGFSDCRPGIVCRRRLPCQIMHNGLMTDSYTRDEDTCSLSRVTLFASKQEIEKKVLHLVFGLWLIQEGKRSLRDIPIHGNKREVCQKKNPSKSVSHFNGANPSKGALPVAKLGRCE